ncbi:hypothetical protein GEV33_005999 [Tenebrio molitor]|uniref:Uncharacterized protein n=1 Tax=Tenebrio molitor TaxID=7067 RepID=A0A8J6HMN5_TENMO|nr:hypothetical protein GEV33_005999 [Tenebrio molitor]
MKCVMNQIPRCCNSEPSSCSNMAQSGWMHDGQDSSSNNVHVHDGIVQNLDQMMEKLSNRKEGGMQKSLQTNRDFQKCKVSKQEASISSGAVFHLVVVVLSVPTTRMKIIPCVLAPRRSFPLRDGNLNNLLSSRVPLSGSSRVWRTAFLPLPKFCELISSQPLTSLRRSRLPDGIPDRCCLRAYSAISMPGQESDFHHFERRRLLSTFVSLSTISEEAFSTVQQKWGKVIINLETLIRMKFVVSPLNEANYLITICAAGPPSDSISVSKSDFVARREGGWFRLYEVRLPTLVQSVAESHKVYVAPDLVLFLLVNNRTVRAHRRFSAAHSSAVITFPRQVENSRSSIRYRRGRVAVNVGCLLCNLLRHYLTSIPHSDPPRRRSRCCTTLRKVRDGIVRACAGNKDRPVAINPAEVVVVINLFGGEFRREMWPSVNVGTDGAACLGPSIKTVKTAAPASPRVDAETVPRHHANIVDSKKTSRNNGKTQLLPNKLGELSVGPVQQDGAPAHAKHLFGNERVGSGCIIRVSFLQMTGYAPGSAFVFTSMIDICSVRTRRKRNTKIEFDRRSIVANNVFDDAPRMIITQFRRATLRGETKAKDDSGAERVRPISGFLVFVSLMTSRSLTKRVGNGPTKRPHYGPSARSNGAKLRLEHLADVNGAKSFPTRKDWNESRNAEGDSRINAYEDPRINAYEDSRINAYEQRTKERRVQRRRDIWPRHPGRFIKTLSSTPFMKNFNMIIAQDRNSVMNAKRTRKLTEHLERDFVCALHSRGRIRGPPRTESATLGAHAPIHTSNGCKCARRSWENSLLHETRRKKRTASDVLCDEESAPSFPYLERGRELGSPGALPEEGPTLGAIMLPRALWSGRGIGFSGCLAGRGTHVGRQNVTGAGGVSSPVT